MAIIANTPHANLLDDNKDWQWTKQIKIFKRFFDLKDACSSFPSLKWWLWLQTKIDDDQKNQCLRDSLIWDKKINDWEIL